MGSFVPEREIRELRDLTRRRTELVTSRGQEVQRLEKELEDTGMKLSSVLSDTFATLRLVPMSDAFSVVITSGFRIRAATSRGRGTSSGRAVRGFPGTPSLPYWAGPATGAGRGRPWAKRRITGCSTARWSA